MNDPSILEFCVATFTRQKTQFWLLELKMLSVPLLE